jgi:cytoskeleton protein RodZ
MYSAVEPKGALSSAPRAGADLSAARERIGWSLAAMAAALHIRVQYLEALEAGRIGDLPGNAYALGFVRTYASALGLDPNEIARRFKAEAAAVNRTTHLAFPVPTPDRGVPAGAVALLGGLAQQATPPHASQPSPVVSPAIAPSMQAVEQQAEGPVAPSISPSSAAAAPVMPTPAPSDQSRIVLRASADAWVQVRDRAGPVLLTRILHAGETWAFPGRPNLLLTTGNAGGTDLVVDGVASPPLGGSGAVRRDLALDPDLIKDGKLASASAPPPGLRPNTQ